MPFGKTPIRKLFEETRSMEGSRHTPNVAIYFYHKSPYSPKFGPIIRLIADMANEQSILASLDTGIEQRPGSKHRTDFMELFHRGDYVEMPTTREGSKWPTD
jgi:hypothetical protein